MVVPSWAPGGERASRAGGIYDRIGVRTIINGRGATTAVGGTLMPAEVIAAMAEAQYILVAPHNPMSPLATAVNVHFAASTPNFHILEYHAPVAGPRKDVLKEPLMVKKDGYLEIPNKPGWGVELNEEAFKSMPPVAWRRGTAFRADGSPYFQ